MLARVPGRDVVVGAGKAGQVIAWDRGSRQRLWSRKVGLHVNDAGPLPRRRVTVCPGLFGGVETPMATADGRVFVPVVDLCGWGSAVARQRVTSVDPTTGAGGSSRSTPRRAPSCGSGGSRLRTSAAPRSRVTSSSPRRSPVSRTRTRRTTGGFSGRSSCRPASTPARRWWVTPWCSAQAFACRAAARRRWSPTPCRERD